MMASGWPWRPKDFTDAASRLPGQAPSTGTALSRADRRMMPIPSIALVMQAQDALILLRKPGGESVHPIASAFDFRLFREPPAWP